MAEDPKRFFQKVMLRGPYADLLQFMQANPDFTVAARVGGDRGHYVHERSTDLEMEPDGYVANPEDPAQEELAYKLVHAVRDDLKEEIVSWNRKIAEELYASLEYNRSDEALIDWMGANEWRFTQAGERVDMTDYLPIDNLEPGIRERVIAEYADLFDRTPEQVYTTLKMRDLRFDSEGNRVNVSLFKRVEELPDKVKAKVLDKYRDLLVEGDDFWAEDVQNDWTEKLEEMGFERIKIRYSLGYSQGDGASFTADNIDVKKLCEVMVAKKQVEAIAKLMVGNLME